VDEKDLILVMVDDASKFGATADEIAWCELAFEDGVLEVIAESAHGLENLAETAVIRDVVADEIGLAHSCRLLDRQEFYR